MILNKDQLVEAVRPQDARTFLRFLETKIDQVLKYPPLLPYSANTTFGKLEIINADQIAFNDLEVVLENL